MDTTGRRSSIMLVLLMVLMVFSHSAGATINPDLNHSVIDSALLDSIYNVHITVHTVVEYCNIQACTLLC